MNHSTNGHGSRFLPGAMALAHAGLYVFPLEPGGKRPVGRLVPRGHLDASRDVEVVKAWWTSEPNANIGVACEPSRLFVIDVDSGVKGGVQLAGWESWRALVDRYGQPGDIMPATWRVRTWSGGWHFYFRAPDDVRLTNSNKGLGANIDVRGNGYVVAPPSVINGKAYAVDPGSKELADTPRWFLECRASLAAPTVQRPVPSGSAAPVTSLAPEAEVVDRIRQLGQELAAAPDGQGNDTASTVAFKVGGYVGAGQVDAEAAVELLLDAISGWTYRDPADRARMERTIRAQLAEGAKRPRPWEVTKRRNGAPIEPFPEPSVTRAIHVVEGIGPMSDSETEAPSRETDWDTDDGQARYLASILTGVRKEAGTGERGGWLIWDSIRWRPVEQDYIDRLVKGFYKDRFDTMAARAGAATGEDSKTWGERAKFYKKFMSQSRYRRILDVFRSEVSIERVELDSHPELLNTPSGVVNLRTGEVGPHDPALYLTKVTKGSYRPGFQHPDWTAALDALPKEDAEYLQLRMGQAVTGYTPESDDCIVLVGNGQNGKSLMTTDGAFRAIGSYGMLAAPGLVLSKDSGSGRASPERASIQGGRFVLIEELPEGKTLSVEELKRIIGTSRIRARMLHQNEVEFDASHTLFITTNYLPAVNETDDGSWRRLCPINFPYKFVSGEPGNADERKGDPGLKSRVRSGRDGQHDAIVTWIVDGARRYLADIDEIMLHRRPDSIAREWRTWRSQADRVYAFLAENVVRDVRSGVSITRQDLYYAFSQFLGDAGHVKWSQETFFTRLLKHTSWRTLGVEESRPLDASSCDRPKPPDGFSYHSPIPKLPTRPRVYTGIRFRRDDDD